MDETEPGQSPNEAYYRLSPLSFLNDSYFIQPDYENQQHGFSHIGGVVQPGPGIEYPGGIDYTASGSPFSLPTNYQPYQLQHPMDLNVLSVDNYREGVHAGTNINRQNEGGTQLYGGFLTNRTRTPSPLRRNMRTRQNSRKDGSSGMPLEENSTRQRGRPRLDTRDQTAAEVRPSDLETHSPRLCFSCAEQDISALNPFQCSCLWS